MFHDVLPLVIKNFKSIKGHYLLEKRKKKQSQQNNKNDSRKQLRNAKNLIKITKSEKKPKTDSAYLLPKCVFATK